MFTLPPQLMLIFKSSAWKMFEPGINYNSFSQNIKGKSRKFILNPPSIYAFGDQEP